MSSGVSKRPRTVNKSCVPCRARKVKCDANVIGLPCSSCTSRQCAESCMLPVRKGRTKKVHVLPTPNSHSTSIHNTPNSDESDHSRQSSIDETQDTPSESQEAERDLLYLNILNEAVKEPTRSTRRNAEEALTPRNCLWTRLPQLDDVDNEYLLKKGVFELPAQPYLDAFIEAFFTHVHPFAPVVSRADFIRAYQSGDCSLLLLRTILTAASVHAPLGVLAACGFASRAAAQESFFTKAKLLHDFAVEGDIQMLQSSIILCMIILDHPTEWDFGYWLHNAIRIATRLDLRTACIRENKSRKVLKVYRRIWWTLFSLDVFHVFVNTRRTRLLEDTPGIKPIKPRSEDDYEAEDVPLDSSGLLPAITPQQKLMPVLLCGLCRIAGQCLSALINKPQQDPRQIMHSIDGWRKSLPSILHLDDNAGHDLYYIHLQALSYRYECILCRLIRRQRNRPEEWKEWAKQRLRAATLELDTMAMRVLASGTLQDFPISFITTITALLALHIESALDPAETDLVRSMSRISISQTMLVLTQGKEIPVLTRALPIFEEILAKKNLYLVGQGPTQQIQTPMQMQEDDVEGGDVEQQGDVLNQFGQEGTEQMYFDADFLGFDFLDEWSIGQMGFGDQY